MSKTDTKQADISVDEQVAKIFTWRRGFNAVFLIDIGVDLGLFKTLAGKPGRSAAEIAGELKLHPPYVETWCLTAFGLGLLDADEQHHYRLAPHMDKILASPGHPRDLTGYVRLGTAFMTEDFELCRKAFHSGETVPFQGRSHAFADTIGDAIGGLHAATARKILPDLENMTQRLEGGAKVLEVGCGTGRFLMQMAKAWPKAVCTGVDIDPTGIEIARNKIGMAGLESRVDVIESDVADLPEASFDAVVMIEVLHEIAPQIRQHVINGCAHVLKPGGWLLIVDETYPSTLQEARQPEFQFPLQTGFEEMTWGNVIPTREEQEQLLANAGFKDAPNRSLIGEGFTILSVQR
ncbi:MAG: methyltransferase domain-containing protein [Betaproteobacteria bacterium]|nr:MAG: methyltransferase domain-containing protein [Betaproteobacteria bacterium]